MVLPQKKSVLYAAIKHGKSERLFKETPIKSSAEDKSKSGVQSVGCDLFSDSLELFILFKKGNTKMKMIYNVKDKPKFGQLIVFAFQQLLAIMAATIAVPMIVGNGMSTSAALFGAGAGTLVYVLFTKAKSPVFLGSSFAFLGSMATAFAGAVTSSALGYLGLIIGAVFAGLVYVIIAVIVKYAGVKWISKIMPSIVIGPIVAIIGLSLAGNAIGDLTTVNYTENLDVNNLTIVEKITTIDGQQKDTMLIVLDDNNVPIDSISVVSDAETGKPVCM